MKARILSTSFHLSLIMCLGFILGCGEASSPLDHSEEQSPPSSASQDLIPSKGDRASYDFPAERDLALLFPQEDALLRWIDHLPSAWLNQVSDALEASELAEDISLESWEEDWKLVSARITPCQPLGRIADPEELDALCWPQVRLVWQPIVEDLTITGVVRPFYADDRAIHTLFFVTPTHPELETAFERIEQGLTWLNWQPSEREAFQNARDLEAKNLMFELQALRGTEGPYEQIKERPELYTALLATPFFEAFSSFLTQHCQPEQLHELTAFSLPLGRSPASADLWSFVAFSGSLGVLTQSPLTVRDAHSGHSLFSFPESEDVTTGHGDRELLEALPQLSDSARQALLSQVITDTDELSEKGARINDPYQTTVAHTTCASCHRANNINFNFHNLSYLEDQRMNVSPRVHADVGRDLSLARILWTTGSLNKDP